MSDHLYLSDFLYKIKKLLEKVLSIDNLNMQITLQTRLVDGVGVESLYLSSIDFVDFLVQVENEYDIVYEFDKPIYTIGDLYEFILAYKSA